MSGVESDRAWKLALAERAVACARDWRVLPGMLSLPDAHGRTWRVYRSDGTLSLIRESGPVLPVAPPALAVLRPDFDDAGSRGCLLEVVRLAWGKPGLWCGRFLYTTSWYVYTEDGKKLTRATSEPEALVSALEAAP